MLTVAKKTGVFFVTSSLLLLAISLMSEVLFHFVVEIAVIFIGFMIYILAINSRQYAKESILMIIGSAYLFVASLDLAHLYMHVGLGNATDNIFKSTQFFVASRFLEALFVLVAVLSIRRIKHYNYKVMFWVAFLLTNIFSVVIVYDLFPSYFGQTGHGDMIRLVTHLSVIVFYFLSGILLYLSNYDILRKQILLAFIGIKIISSLLLLNYVTSRSINSDFGFVLHFMSYGGLYVLFIADIVNSPYKNIFNLFAQREKELLEKSQRDSLTNLYNHSTTFNKIIDRMKKESPEGFGLLMIDIDDFKHVNDQHGHLAGDEVLIELSNLLLSLTENKDIVGRYGGDEFLYLIDHCTSTCLQKKVEYINEGLDYITHKLNIGITLSYGGVTYERGDSITQFIKKADTKLYESKAKGKNQLNIWKKDLKDD